ncbi:sulfatase-like hydrolase/transferase, partial [Halobacterium bonnevillei]
EFENLRLDGKTDRATGGDEGSAGSLRATLSDSVKSRKGSLAESAPVVALSRYYQYLTEWPSARGSTVVEALTNNIEANDAPFFAWTHLMDIHRPIHPTVANNDDTLHRYSLRQQFAVDSHASTNQFDARSEVIYDNAVRYVDRQIGAIIDNLRQEGVWGNTCLVVTGDHGEALFDRDRYGHPRHYLYDELLHVPLLIDNCSGESKRISHPFSLAWLGELIAEMVGINPPDFPSSSGYETHFDDKTADVPVVSDALDSHGHSVAVRNGEYKYVTRSLTPDADMSVIETPTDTGYHVASDRGERCPLNGDTVPDPLVEYAESIVTEPSALPRLEGGFTREAERRLEQLGYKM